MSLNKVLNRPLFRQEALRKGALKPIRALEGDFIGPMPSDISMREMPKPSKFQRFKNFVGKGISGLKGMGKEVVLLMLLYLVLVFYQVLKNLLIKLQDLHLLEHFQECLSREPRV